MWQRTSQINRQRDSQLDSYPSTECIGNGRAEGDANERIIPPRNRIKAHVFGVMFELKPGGYTVLDLQLACPQLTEPQIRAALRRGISAKKPYIERTLDQFSPNSPRHKYALTMRGISWVRWATQTGLYGTVEESEVDEWPDSGEEAEELENE
jgi:hypothetical protein